MNGFKDLRYEVLRILQVFTFVATSLATISNIINKRPGHVIIQPILATLFILVLWYFEKKSPKYKYMSKLIFMVFFNIIYLPFAWIYSPGISSAIGYYAVLTVVLTVFFVEKKIEFIIPLFGVIFSIFMIQYELYHAQAFSPFLDRATRFNDVTINFIAVIFLLFSMITYINRHYVQAKEEFYKQSITDELTGLFNRRYLLDHLETLSDQNKSEAFSVFFIDINNFKSINDNYGHHIGDEVLIKLGEILQKNCSICGRFGGDEFMAIESRTEEKDIKRLEKALKDQFQAYALSKSFNNLSLSIGYTLSKQQSAEEMIKAADEYMYQNKRQIK